MTIPSGGAGFSGGTEAGTCRDGRVAVCACPHPAGMSSTAIRESGPPATVRRSAKLVAQDSAAEPEAGRTDAAGIGEHVGEQDVAQATGAPGGRRAGSP